jgi:hypothetical protein
MRYGQGYLEEALELLARSRDLFATLGLDRDVVTVEETIAQIRRQEDGRSTGPAARQNTNKGEVHP